MENEIKTEFIKEETVDELQNNEIFLNYQVKNEDESEEQKYGLLEPKHEVKRRNTKKSIDHHAKQDMFKKRAFETPEQREARLQQHRERQRFKRANETPEQREARLQQHRERQRIKKANETPEEREARLKRDREISVVRRAAKKAEEKRLLREEREIAAQRRAQEITEAGLKREREIRAAQRAKRSLEQKREENLKRREKQRLKRANETPEQREARLKQLREYKRLKKSTETLEEREARLKRDREFKALRRLARRQYDIRKRDAETPEEREERLRKIRERHAIKRANETAEEREIRLKRERELAALKKTCVTPEQRRALLRRNRKYDEENEENSRSEQPSESDSTQDTVYFDMVNYVEDFDSKLLPTENIAPSTSTAPSTSSFIPEEDPLSLSVSYEDGQTDTDSQLDNSMTIKEEPLDELYLNQDVKPPPEKIHEIAGHQTTPIAFVPIKVEAPYRFPEEQNHEELEEENVDDKFSGLWDSQRFLHSKQNNQ